jgi:murein DD-endopeptidase MepM/ murein hydrolase activator NlpD
LSKIIVRKGEAVSKGTIIGLVGATGNTRGKHSAAHLHFELIVHHKRCNPLPHLMW